MCFGGHIISEKHKDTCSLHNENGYSNFHSSGIDYTCNAYMKEANLCLEPSNLTYTNLAKKGSPGNWRGTRNHLWRGTRNKLGLINVKKNTNTKSKIQDTFISIIFVLL